MKAIYISNWLNHLFITGGRWVIGDPKINAGGLRTTRTGLSHPPASGWEYALGNDWTKDPQIKVSGENLVF